MCPRFYLYNGLPVMTARALLHRSRGLSPVTLKSITVNRNAKVCLLRFVRADMDHPLGH